jgi:hypothetical protein
MHLRLILMLCACCAIPVRAGAPARTAGALVREAQTTLTPTPRSPEQAVAPSTATIMPIPGSGHSGPRDVCDELVTLLQHYSPMPTKPSALNAPAQQTAPASSPREPAAQAKSDETKPLPGQTAPPVDKAQHASGQTGPIPNGANAFKPPPVSLEQAQEFAARGDQRGCRDAAQEMRRNGVTMPDTLIALAALRPDLLPQSPAR